MDVNLDELEKLKRWYGKQHGRVRLATGAMLNSFAFGTRTQAIGHINETMTVRNSKFVSGSMRVSKANIESPVPRQKAVTGSIFRPRFSGWVEQEFGTGQNRSRSATLAGRGNTFAKQIRHVVRLKPRNTVVTRAEYGMASSHLNKQFIAAALRKKENRLIRIGGVLLKRRRKKFEVVQLLKKPKQPKRDKWMLTSRNSYFRKTNLDALWRRHYRATLKR